LFGSGRERSVSVNVPRARSRGRRRLALAGALLALGCVGVTIAQADETIMVHGDGSTVTTRSLLQTGTMLAISGELTPSGGGKYDAFYLEPPPGATPERSDLISVKSAFPGSTTAGALSAFLEPPYPAYQDSHVYHVRVGSDLGPTTFWCDFCHPSNPYSGSFTVAISGPGAACGDCVTVGQLQRKVEVQRAEAGWEPATVGMKLVRGDRVHTGFKASVVLTFPDGSRLQVGDMALIQINDVGLGPQGGIRARLFLKTGEVTAEVNRSTGASGDFQVKTPTTTASVRGTVFSVRFDGSATTVAVTKSSVQVTANNGATATVPAGMETRSTATSVAVPAPIGHGFTSGGLSDIQAIARLSGSIAKGLSRCKLGVVSNRLSPVTGGWSIGLVIVGANQGEAAKPKGTASFRLAGTRVRPGNKLARRIVAGCR
jgi:FecR-like protein